MINIDTLKQLNESKKKFVVIAIFLGFGVLLMIFSNNLTKTDNYTQNKQNNSQDAIIVNQDENLTDELKNILSLVDGLGKTRVMIKYKASSEKIPLMEEGGSNRIITDNSSGKTSPFISKEIYPQIEGVIIVCESDNQDTKQKVSYAISEVLGIPLHKVHILKMYKGD